MRSCPASSYGGKKEENNWEGTATSKANSCFFPFPYCLYSPLVSISSKWQREPKRTKVFSAAFSVQSVETPLPVTEVRSFTFFHAFSGRQKRSRPPRCPIRQRLRLLAWLLYVGQYSSPAPRHRSSRGPPEQHHGPGPPSTPIKPRRTGRAD